MRVKIKLLSATAKPPVYATDGAACADIFSDLNSPVTLQPGASAMIPTGIAAGLEKGYAMFLYARSGLASKSGVTLANCVGVIDSDYRGEIFVALRNMSDAPYTVSPGERIAQAVVMPVEKADYTACEDLDETARGSGGFGSTGKSEL